MVCSILLPGSAEARRSPPMINEEAGTMSLFILGVPLAAERPAGRVGGGSYWFCVPSAKLSLMKTDVAGCWACNYRAPGRAPSRGVIWKPCFFFFPPAPLFFASIN